MAPSEQQQQPQPQQQQQQAAVGRPVATAAQPFSVQGPPSGQPGGFYGSAQGAKQQEGYYQAPAHQQGYDQKPPQPPYPSPPVYHNTVTNTVVVEESCCTLQMILWGVGWLFPICWIVGAFLPLCIRLKPGDKPGWILNIIFALVEVALIITAAVLISQAQNRCSFQYNGYQYSGPCTTSYYYGRR